MSLKREQIIRKNKTGKTYIIQPEHIKRQAVKELDEGSISIKEAMIKYQVLSRISIVGWLKEYSINKEDYNRPIHSTDTERRKIVKDIESGLITVLEATKQYHKSTNTIKSWIRKYRSSITLVLKNTNMDTIDATCQDTINKLENALKSAQLKISSLETLIDISEQEYKFEIRKKFGTKQ